MRVSEAFRLQYGDPETLKKIAEREVGRYGSFPRRSGDIPGMDPQRSRSIPTLTRAGAPETLTANGLRLTASEERLDVEFRKFQDAYPAARRKGGLLTEQAYLAQVHNAGGAAALLEALDNHKQSEQWKNPQLVPGMDIWLTEERWRQRLDAPSATPKTWAVPRSAARS
jgi:hypothetical protein